jgi:L-alanine-DL-glutamate epimerase-like enolase superfamily enzyme
LKLTGIAWSRYRIPFVQPYETARGRVTHRTGYIVRAMTDVGVAGLGEAALDPSAPEEGSAAIEPHLRMLAGVVLREGARLDEAMEPYLHGDDAMRAANCAIETAVADAGCRWAGAPLASMFSGRPEGSAPGPVVSVEVNATVANQRTGVAAAAALAAKASGFGTVKLKVGMEPTIEAEVERVHIIRDVLGPDIRLRLDANGAWSEAVAIDMVRELEVFDIELIEQPVSDIEALGRLRSVSAIPLAADEAVYDFASGQRALAHADLLVLKPMRLGGPTVARYLAQYANASGLEAFVTTTIDTGVATAMALHVAASLPGSALAHGLATASLLESDLLAQPLRLERGRLYLPESPGLGVDLDEAAMTRYGDGWQEVTA